MAQAIYPVFLIINNKYVFIILCLFTGINYFIVLSHIDIQWFYLYF